MTKKAREEFQLITINMFKRDLDYLRFNFQDNYNAQIRRIIRGWLEEQLDWVSADEDSM